MYEDVQDKLFDIDRLAFDEITSDLHLQKINLSWLVLSCFWVDYGEAIYILTSTTQSAAITIIIRQSPITPLLTSITLWCFESENVSSLSGTQASSPEKHNYNQWKLR